MNIVNIYFRSYQVSRNLFRMEIDCHFEIYRVLLISRFKRYDIMEIDITKGVYYILPKFHSNAFSHRYSTIPTLSRFNDKYRHFSFCKIIQYRFFYKKCY